MKICKPSDATKNLLELAELFYHSTHKGSVYDFDDILDALYIDKLTDGASKDIHVLRKCMRYAKDMVSEIKILTAADLLKINSAIIDSDTKVLEDECLLSVPSGLIDDVWGILHDLYNPNKRYPLLLEAAIAVCRLLTLSPQWKVDLWTLRVLFDTIYPEDLNISGISKQCLILIDPEKPLYAYDMESLVLTMLSVFENIWRNNHEIYFAMREKEREIQNLIQESSPKLRDDRILSALTSNICLSNTSFREKTGVSHGTAVNYLKDLESVGVLYSKIESRERLYFNKIICDLAYEKLRVM